MRIHEATTYWRRIYRQPYPVRLLSLSYIDVIGVGDGRIEFTGGISAIVGGNGVGKTTLLEAARACLAPNQTVYPPTIRDRLRGALLRVAVDRYGEPLIIETMLDSNGASSRIEDPPVPVTLLSPAFESARVIELFAAMGSIEDLIQGFAPAKLDGDELEELCYVVGKNYDEVCVYEISDFDDEETFPYFRVRIGSTWYGTEAMGLGEIALHLTLWHLRRVPRDSVLLVEEPETFIAPRSQLSLLDVLAKVSAEMRVWTIITTHSAAIVSRVPIEHVTLFAQSADRTVVDKATRSMLNEVVGMRTHFSGAIFVEDRAAREFTIVLLGKLAPDLLEAMEVRDVQQDGMRKALLDMPEVGPWLALIGLYDGDMRERVDATVWPHTFLPGNVPPEQLMQQASLSSVEELARVSGKSPDRVRLVLAQLSGLDHHDWLEELHKLLHITYEVAVMVLASAWIENESNAQSALTAVSETRQAVDLARKRPLAGAARKEPIC